MNIENKRKYELLKVKNKSIIYEKNWKNNELFMECIELLKDCLVLSKEESEELFHDLQMRVSFKNGRIDWKKVAICSRISVEKLKEKIKNNKQYYVLWDSYDVPCVYSELQTIINNLNDILAVSSNTWLLSERKDEVIEFYHEGEIMYGLLR